MAPRCLALMLGLGLAGLVGRIAPAQAVPDHAASSCVLGCNMEKKACIQSARMLKLECRATCRATVAPAERGGCRRACNATFRSTSRETCRPQHRSCHQDCIPARRDHPTGCAAPCGKALAACARAVVADGRACVKGCRTAADRPGCLGQCAAVAEDGAAACASAFTDCHADCDDDDDGSPTGAFTGMRH